MINRNGLTGYIVLAALIGFSFCAAAESVEVERTIVALYDSTDPYLNKADYNLIHQSAEMPLNYLGQKVIYHDLAGGLPDEAVMRDARGIITWFNDMSLREPSKYCDWLAGQINNGKKVVIMGNIGAHENSLTGEQTDIRSINKVFNALGLEYKGNWTDNAFVIEAVPVDRDMSEFERTLEGETNFYEQITAVDDAAEVYLRIKRTDMKDSESAAVVITDKGGFVLDGYEIYIEPNGDRKKWRINPFRFFKEAYSLEGIPCYDTTTLFGKRIFYSHIDGDGFRNVSLIDGKTFSGAVIKEEVLEKYDFPVTVSFITSEIDKKYFGNDELIGIAKGILSLPNVEAGVHGFTHPLDWENKLTAFGIEGYSHKISDSDGDDIPGETAYGTSCVVSATWEEYLTAEIPGAIDYMNESILPEGKRVEVYQWTGNCMPTEDAIILTKEKGVYNINGGDSRYDGYYPSYNGVAPLTRQVGENIQVYTSNMNENIYTHEWTGPFDGYENVIQTFKNTEYPTSSGSYPRRVSPINVYYHFYTGERKDSIRSIKNVYDYVLSIENDLCPVFTSRYLAIVKGFISGKIERLETGGWRFFDYGECRTLRITKNGEYPDLDRSIGVLGFREWEDFIYIHLADKNEAILYLSEIYPRGIYLKDSSAVLKDVVINKEKISFEAELIRDSEVSFANIPLDNTYKVSIMDKSDGKTIYEKRIVSDTNGDMKVLLPGRGDIEVTIRDIKA